MHVHSRRGFFARLGAGWLGASLMEQAVARAALARAQADAAPAGMFELRKVAEGVFAALPRDSTITQCNAAVFENANDLLVVDTHSMPSAAAAVVAELRPFTSKPVRYVVNTHFHGDHVLGNPGYRKLAPKAEFISSEETRRLIAERDPGAVKGWTESVPQQIEQLERAKEKAKPAEKVVLEKQIEQWRAFAREMRGYEIELPNITFERNLVIHEKAHELHLAFRGRGHTAGDIVVFCPEKKVIATGDLLHSWLPYVGDGYPNEWPATLDAIGEFPFERVIGGHGDPQPTRERLPQMRDYIAELTEVVAAGKERGRTVRELQEKITPATLKTLGGAYGVYVGGELAKVRGKTPAEALADGLKENVASTFRALGRT